MGNAPLLQGEMLLLREMKAMPSLAPYEVYAVRYGYHERRAAENFLGGDPHNAPMPSIISSGRS